jgi:hypothetical protein
MLAERGPQQRDVGARREIQVRDAFGDGPAGGIGPRRPPVRGCLINDAAHEGARVFEIVGDGNELWMHTLVNWPIWKNDRVGGVIPRHSTERLTIC